MGKWRTLFESNLPPVEQREFEEVYEFGPPATAEQLAAAEQALGVQLPADVREMLSEFNGVGYTTASDRKNGFGPGELDFLDTRSLSIDVPDYFADCGNPLPDPSELKQVVFVRQSNGLSVL